jgi:uncharacterized membrane protein
MNRDSGVVIMVVGAGVVFAISAALTGNFTLALEAAVLAVIGYLTIRLWRRGKL